MAISNLNALSVAMNAEQDSTVQALKLRLLGQQLALEHARRTAEDARGHLRQEREYLINDVIKPAEDILVEARAEIRRFWQDRDLSRQAALTAAYNALGNARKLLREDESASESEED